MHCICVIAIVIFANMITCENVNSTDVRWKYDVDTAEPLTTILESKSRRKFRSRFDMICMKFICDLIMKI